MTVSMWIALVVFTGIVFAAALYGLSVSGHFPMSSRSPALRTPMGHAILWLTLALTLAAVLVALGLAWARLPWPAAVIAAGLALLFAPMALQPLPDRFVDGWWALVTFSGTATVLALAVWCELV